MKKEDSSEQVKSMLEHINLQDAMEMLKKEGHIEEMMKNAEYERIIKDPLLRVACILGDSNISLIEKLLKLDP